MKCCVCGSTIKNTKMKKDVFGDDFAYIAISYRVNFSAEDACSINFHSECFLEAAGEEYFDKLRKELLKKAKKLGIPLPK